VLACVQLCTHTLPVLEPEQMGSSMGQPGPADAVQAACTESACVNFCTPAAPATGHNPFNEYWTYQSYVKIQDISSVDEFWQIHDYSSYVE